MTPYDQWKLETPPYCEALSEAEEAAARINAHIADSLDLTAMDVLAVADEEEGTVELYIGEFHCGEFRWDHALAHWRAEIATAFSKAMSKSRPRKAG